MFDFYTFDFLATITKQLEDRLEALAETPLTDQTLRDLAAFQTEHDSKQGVYLLHYADEPVYVGKADDVQQRLGQHFKKLRGRRNIEITQVGFKCLLLDKSMSTSANENLLFETFREKGFCEWNGSGFGPKDPGQNRDTTVPNKFDTRYPINEKFACEMVEDRETVTTLLRKLKKNLPFLLRHEKPGQDGEKEVNLSGVERSAKTLLRAAAASLGEGWQATVFKSHMILYKQRRDYQYGKVIYPQV